MIVDEGEGRTLTGHVTGAEVSVRRCCTKCSDGRQSLMANGDSTAAKSVGCCRGLAVFRPMELPESLCQEILAKKI